MKWLVIAGLAFFVFFSALFFIDFKKEIGWVEVVPTGTSVETHPRAVFPVLTLDQKIGQLLFLGIPDKKLSRETAEWLRKNCIGGVLFLGKNVESPAQVKVLTRDLQRDASCHKELPLFVGVDQEGGRVTQLWFLKEKTAQDEIETIEEAYQVALRRARELRELGINVNASPVLDIASCPGEFICGRSFRGKDEKTIAALGAAMIKGYRAGGIVPIAKHFPGHGGTKIDSHRSLPVLTIDVTALKKSIIPFERAIGEKVEMIMVAHLFIPILDPLYPTSLSSRVIREFLRDALGYQGVIITDELRMRAVSDTYSLSEAAVRAIEAGSDIALIDANVSEYEFILAAIKEAVEDGRISEKRVDESVERILALKEKIK